MEQNSARVFSENWNVYQKLISHNYMHHKEFVARVIALFNKMPGKKIQILDIGCGDAVTLLPVLRQTAVASYTGYDLSSSALQLASLHLSWEHFPYVLKEGNMIELIQKEEKYFDIIYSSFAIHHLYDDAKKELLKACFDRLIPGGKMIYTDVFRQSPVNRDEYIEEYFSYIKNDWPLLSANEKQPIYEHIGQYDFPSDLNETIGWINNVPGFSVSENYQPDHRHAMLLLNKV